MIHFFILWTFCEKKLEKLIAWALLKDIPQMLISKDGQWKKRFIFNNSKHDSDELRNASDMNDSDKAYIMSCYHNSKYFSNIKHLFRICKDV